MKKLTQSEATDILATLGMGWEKRAWWWDPKEEKCAFSVNAFRPLTDANHALMVLEAWRNGDECYRSYTVNSLYDPDKAGTARRSGFSVNLYGLPTNKKCVISLANISNPNLNHAICTAVCSALLGEQVTIEEGE